jgi:hypothetical protein
VTARSVIEEAVSRSALSAALERAVNFAKENQQIAIWDRSPQPYAIALYEERTKELRPLTDEEAAIILNGDPSIAQEWSKWNAMSQNSGSLIVLDVERVRRMLKPDEASDDEIEGRA